MKRLDILILRAANVGGGRIAQFQHNFGQNTYISAGKMNLVNSVGIYWPELAKQLLPGEGYQRFMLKKFIAKGDLKAAQAAVDRRKKVILDSESLRCQRNHNAAYAEHSERLNQATEDGKNLIENNGDFWARTAQASSQRRHEECAAFKQVREQRQAEAIRSSVELHRNLTSKYAWNLAVAFAEEYNLTGD